MTFQYCFDGSIKKVNNLSVSSPRTWGCFAQKQRGHGGKLSSPRTWGCFCRTVLYSLRHQVFPTHVGVFLPLTFRAWITAGLPHARGGVSHIAAHLRYCAPSSPRTWGCFHVDGFADLASEVFPTHVGVFPQRSSPDGTYGSSPRTWGCFPRGPRPTPTEGVFPTHVGVFLDQFPCC